MIRTDGDVVFLEGPAAAVWDCLDPPGTDAEVVLRCADRYDLTAATVQTSLDELRDRGLCEVQRE